MRHGIFFCITGPLWGESTRRWIPITKGPVMQSFDVLLIVNLVQLLNKQYSGQLFKMPWYSYGVTPGGITAMMNKDFLNTMRPSKWPPFCRLHFQIHFLDKNCWFCSEKSNGQISHHWFRWWPGACLMPSHYLKQWWPSLIMHMQWCMS